MSDLSDRIKDTFPGNGDQGVPLQSNLTFTLSGLDYDEDSLKEGIFVEGPDTDQFVGPGQIDLVVPANVSQGDIDDFLQSPGYQGIVAGEVTVTGIAGDTVVTFDPTLPLAPLTEYTMNLTGVLDSSEVDIDGFVTLSFITGTGSIEEVPADVSSSVLSAGVSESASIADSATPFQVKSITPSDLSVENPTDLSEIVVEFNKPIDPASVDGNVSVTTVPATDHPNAPVNSQGDLAISTEVEGNKLRIKI